MVSEHEKTHENVAQIPHLYRKRPPLSDVQVGKPCLMFASDTNRLSRSATSFSVLTLFYAQETKTCQLPVDGHRYHLE